MFGRNGGWLATVVAALVLAACGAAEGATQPALSTLAPSEAAGSLTLVDDPRDVLIDQLVGIGMTTTEATCIADNLDVDDPRFQNADIAAMLDLLEPCGIDDARLGELSG